MVRADEIRNDEPTTAARSAIAGGFALIPVPSLMAAWAACRARPLGIVDFRSWLAAHEMLARRQRLEVGRAPTFTHAELARLLGVTERRARASLRRLQAAGFLSWSPSAIELHGPSDAPSDGLIGDSIGRGRGTVAIPRRVLRFLARGARPALIAAALGILLRCLSRRRSGFHGRGRVKASWIAHAFDVEPRRVKQARAELVALAWIAPEASDQWSLNRWGAAYRIDLRWSPTRTDSQGLRLAPPPPCPGRPLAHPESHPDPLSGGARNQEPVARRSAGARASGSGMGDLGTPRDGATRAPSPRLEDVRPEDLAETSRLMELHGQAVSRGLVSPSEADRLRFVAAAEHARVIGRTNSCGLFAHLIRGRKWRYLTGADEDRASARLRAHRRASEPVPPVMVAQPRRPMVGHATARAGPSDAEIVRSIRQAAIRAGVYRDPGPDFVRLHPGWTMVRWEAAMSAMGG